MTASTTPLQSMPLESTITPQRLNDQGQRPASLLGHPRTFKLQRNQQGINTLDNPRP